MSAKKKARQWEAYKHGDLQSGNWEWAVGTVADSLGRRRHLCSINFYVAPDHNPAQIAQVFADTMNKAGFLPARRG